MKGKQISLWSAVLCLLVVCKGVTERGWPGGLEILAEVEGIEPPAAGGYTCRFGKRPGYKNDQGKVVDNDGHASVGGECRKCKPSECHYCCSHFSHSDINSDHGNANYINCMRQCCGCANRGTADDGQNCIKQVRGVGYDCEWFPVDGCGRISNGNQCSSQCNNKASCETCCETSYVGNARIEECKKSCGRRWG